MWQPCCNHGHMTYRRPMLTATAAARDSGPLRASECAVCAVYMMHPAGRGLGCGKRQKHVLAMLPAPKESEFVGVQGSFAATSRLDGGKDGTRLPDLDRVAGAQKEIFTAPLLNMEEPFSVTNTPSSS